MTEPAGIVLETVVREEWGRLTSLLLAQYRRLDLVEDALGDAVEAAARRWPADGTPDNPSAWLLTTARRRVIDRVRAESMAHRKAALLVTDAEHRQGRLAAMADPGGLVEDDLLRLVLMCTHPALAPEAASALALRLVLGVSTHDIARLFLVSEPTVAARITRAKKKIVAAGIPFAVPAADVLPHRLDTVAQTAYLAFTAGYAPGSGPDLLRADLAGEAIRLVRVVVDLRPAEPAPVALLALMLLQHSRRDARVGGDGRLVLLADQDRRRWRRDEIDEALARLADPVLTGPVSPLAASYIVQARIAAEHATVSLAGGHPLGPDRRPLRPAAPARPFPERPTRPCGRRRRGVRPRGRPRRARGDRGPRQPPRRRRPRGAAVPPRRRRRGPHRLRGGDRGVPQRH